VEVKNSVFGAGAKANHLAYVGDATVGAGSNIGAGTITCNYDGAHKHRTELGDNVFIGSNSTLVAPLTVENGGFVAAGSTVTSKVGESQLAVGRAKQRNIDGWKRPEKPKQ
jgi:bifunctional UDP-N-acetylglucosamine pyrophosphorylase/glucosamine-1-phosphate N-acetyltransferase